MAAGLSKKQITSRIYNRLKSLEYQLSKAGVSTQYRKGTANTRGYLVFFEGHDAHSMEEFVNHRWTGDGGFNIKYSSGNMSNGETVITARIYTVLRGVNRVFGRAEKDGSFEQGLDFIKQNFSTAPTPRQHAMVIARWGIAIRRQHVYALETRTDVAGCDGSGRDKAQRDTRTPGSEQDAASASGIR